MCDVLEHALMQLKAVLGTIIDLPEEQWALAAPIFQLEELKLGDFFIREGEPSERMGFVCRGLTRFFYSTSDGKEFNKNFITENGFVGAYSACLTTTHSRFNIQALEPTRLLTAAYEDIFALYDKHRCWLDFARIMAEQIYITKEQREAEFLLDSPETRYRNFLARSPGLESRLAQYHIASYLGITPVSLSRIRSRMEKDKIINSG